MEVLELEIHARGLTYQVDHIELEHFELFHKIVLLDKAHPIVSLQQMPLLESVEELLAALAHVLVLHDANRLHLARPGYGFKTGNFISRTYCTLGGRRWALYRFCS